MIASDLMTESVISVTTEASVQAVAQLLLERHVGAVPVTDHSGVPIGMVRDRYKITASTCYKLLSLNNVVIFLISAVISF